MFARRAAALIRGLCLVALIGLVLPTVTHAAFTSDQQKCVTTFNKQFRKVASTVGKDFCGCIKDRSKSTDTDDKLAGLSVTECFDADRKEKVAKTSTKATEKIAAACAGPADPGVAVTDAATLITQAIQKEKSVFEAMFGPDVDTGVARIVDAGKDPSKCQLSVAKAMKKCQDTKINAFVKCKKDAMKAGKEPFLTGAMTTEEIASCINTAWVVDEKQKVAKKCNLDALGKVDGIRKTITKKCVEKAVDLSDTFPGCGTDDGEELHTCIETQLECATCLALEATDALGSANLVGDHCDIIDNGLPDDSCNLLTATVVTIPSTAEPAETPGTSGVVVTNPNLITQFGGAGFDLNTATYTRWRARGGPDTPEAIVILVAGFGGGANNFKVMAEDLIPRVRADHGLEIEVWGFSRRTNQLEDREGALIGQNLNDAQVALDWYYGDDLGIPLNPALVAGPNRRAFIYNTSDDIPFIANFTGQTHSIDIDMVVEAARAIVNNDNVFLGGHSAGTGFTARYAATDFDLTGGGPVEAGYAKLRGLIMLEGGAGSTATDPLTADSMDRMEAKFDGGLFGAVRDNAARCVDGTTPCTVATEAVDCVAQVPPKCTLPETAYGAVFGLSPGVVASSEPGAIQGASGDPDTGLLILQVDQSGPDTSAIESVPALALLNLLFNPNTFPATASGLVGAFLDDDGLGAGLSPAISTSFGQPGPVVGGINTWLDINEGGGIFTDNGPPPTTISSAPWGVEAESVRIDRYSTTFLHAGTNAADWYFGTAGLGMTNSPGVCDTGGTLLCTAGNVGAVCAADVDCAQFISLDSTALSVGRGRRDIVNLTQAGNIDIPVISFGGSNGLVPVPGRMTAFGESIATCAAPSCTGTARVVDPNAPSPAFPTFGDVDGGYEVHISEGYAHQDVTVAEDDATNNVLAPLSDFIARNVIP